MIAWISQQIDKWNDTLGNFFLNQGNNSLLGGVIALVLFVFACWAISYFTKK